MHDVIAVRVLEGYQLQLTFDDGSVGVADMTPFIEREGVFSPLRKLDFFRQVTVNSDIGTICWPNGADLCPDVLYSLATGKDLPKWAAEPARR
jgi:hypothetical protein